MVDPKTGTPAEPIIDPEVVPASGPTPLSQKSVEPSTPPVTPSVEPSKEPVAPIEPTEPKTPPVAPPVEPSTELPKINVQQRIDRMYARLTYSNVLIACTRAFRKRRKQERG